jgi:hypothetical protein
LLQAEDQRHPETSYGRQSPTAAGLTATDNVDDEYEVRDCKKVRVSEDELRQAVAKLRDRAVRYSSM